jgi:CBS domain-containing protein
MNAHALLRQKQGEIFSINQGDSLCKCIDALNEKKIGALIVTDDAGKLAGIISERDVLHSVKKTPIDVCSVRVKDAMTPRKKLVVVSEETSIQELMEVMTQNRVRHLPVVREEDLCGIISIGDVVKSLLDNAIMENESMRSYIVGEI